MTQNQLQKRVKLWQKRLGLQDWAITVRFVDAGFECENEGTLGACSVHRYKRKAWIEVLHPKFRGPEDDIEETIVHELLHVLLPAEDLRLGNDTNSGPFIAYERGIDQMARALIKGYDD